MRKSFSAMSVGLQRAVRVVALLGAAALTGCATHYVDGSTKEVNAAQFKKPVQAKPVQLVFEFQTKGVVNARGTDFLKSQVIEQVQGSGLFSQVDDKPVPGGALLSVTLNNVPLTDDAFSKGFAAGLTFGLAGSQVSDGYVCTVKYLGTGQDALTKTARHAIHTTVGASKTPDNAVKVDNIEQGVRMMTKQVVSTALNDLSQDAAFK